MMRKLLMAMGLAFVFMINIYGQDITLNINNNDVATTVAPIEEAGTTLVPLRIIGENLGAIVQWDASSQKITITKDTIRIELELGSKTVSVNNVKKQISVPAKSIKGTTMVPIRFISENMGAQVDWDSKMRIIKVRSTEQRYYAIVRYTEDSMEDYYEGEVILRDGIEMLDGKGKLFFKDGAIYEGYFENDHVTKGKVTLADGEIQEGTFKDTNLHGQGKVVLPNGLVYQGEFDGNYFNGTIVYPDGIVYEGGIKEGEYFGKGKLTFPNESIYEGEFSGDHFRGKITYIDGTIYEGEFRDGTYYGEGKVTFSDGSVYEGSMEEYVEEIIGE